MRLSQRQFEGLRGRSQFPKQRITFHPVIPKPLPPIEKVVEKVIFVPSPPQVVVKEKIVEREKQIPAYTFEISQRNRNGRITRIKATSLESDVILNFVVQRDADDKMVRVTMKKSTRGNTIYGTVQ